MYDYETISYDEVCRLCISYSKTIDIFSIVPDLNINYFDLVLLLVQPNTFNDLNELPKGICDECALKLIQFYQFKTQTEVSQVELIKLLECPDVDENLPEVDESLNEITNENKESDELYESTSEATDFDKLKTLNDSLLNEIKNKITECDEILYETTNVPYEHETNNVNIIELFHEPNDDEELNLLKESSNKIIFNNNFKIEVLEGFNEMFVDEIENNTVSTEEINKMENMVENKFKTCESLVEYDATPKFTLIDNTQQLPIEEQYIWQQKLAKWVTKIPRGKRKSNVAKSEKLKKLFQCEICGRCFSSKATERNHQTVHTGEKKFECEICHKRFTRIYHVKDHLRIHQGIQPYKCETCGKAFTKNSDLHRHKRLHSNIAVYTCDQCGKEFKWKTSFDIHLNSHTGIKAHKCSKCTNAYTSSCSLKKHQIKYNHL